MAQTSGDAARRLAVVFRLTEGFASEDQRVVPGELPRRADEIDALAAVAHQGSEAIDQC
ncbi:hypothetical protein [Amycolatopsis taiwanensis]|uniref:Uncharacterized protein n=1 Tax=Amycolatopsis taiwanensis TaxID=342230 RepID=A0A9W6VGF1_9PSEU|nr:hypothetical protein [Amycolatopsis taiwanensis]GLY70718.1 hypothetical protein Atai01_73370 [Amycolatopsis taiwanensis]